MYQVTFSDQAMREMNRVDKIAQLALIEPISNITDADLSHPREPLGRFHRDGHAYYRMRSGECRFYFQVKDGPSSLGSAAAGTIHVNYILHKNSLEDFLLRNKLPVSEQQLVEQHSKFWKYLEGLTK